MQLRRLGGTDLEIAPIVMGGNVFGWTAEEATSVAILDDFLAAGFSAVDTADVYSRWAPGHTGGESETVLGNWMKNRRNRQQVTLITKVGMDVGQGQPDLTEKYILQAVDKSLQRLQTDHIDLYLTHTDDPRTPVEETLGAYAKLIAAGKVRWIGASNLSPDRLVASLRASEEHGLPRYEVFQPCYNLYDRQDFEDNIDPVCRKYGLGVITYFALASGFLTGKYREQDDLSKSVRGDRVEKYLDKRGFAILEALDAVADQHRISAAGVALAWLINNPRVTAPIASATKRTHLQAFIEAMHAELDKTDMERLTVTSDMTTS